ncbi:MAG: hypothetical protein MZV65_14725 [Chromatiales bacterium]|nr:hypothetical protein [Chromatiales bacterium]
MPPPYDSITADIDESTTDNDMRRTNDIIAAAPRQARRAARAGVSPFPTISAATPSPASCTPRYGEHDAEALGGRTRCA